MNFLRLNGRKFVLGFPKYKEICLEGLTCESKTEHSMFMPTYDFLKKLHMKHIQQFAFSNSDYFNRRNECLTIGFRPDLVIFNMIDTKKGVCMELNFAFGLLLDNLGYKVKYVKCLKRNKDRYYKIFHLGLIVTAIDETKGKLQDYFVDIGFGEYFRYPIPIGKTTDEPIDGLQITENYNHLTIRNMSDYSEILLVYTSYYVSMLDIIENYVDFYRSEANDFPLCKSLSERIYSNKDQKFVELDKPIRSKL